MLKKGDIFLSSKKSIIAKFLEYFQDDEVNWGHVSIVADNNKLLEASFFGIREVDIEKFISKYHKYKVIRYTKLTDADAGKIIDIMDDKIGKMYSYKIIFLQILDQITHSNKFTSVLNDENDHVCSTFVAWGFYKILDFKFNNVSWQSCEPDDIEDHTLCTDDWITVEETV